jgi:biotin carboxylase
MAAHRLESEAETHGMGNHRRTLMILGAGPLQAPAIRRAVESGLRVVSVDYLPDNVGHRYSHEYVDASTTDADAVLVAARRIGINGIMTLCSDVAVPTVGTVCDALGLPGVSRRSADLLCYKHAFRRFQRDAGLPHPRFLEGNDLGELASRAARELSGLVLVKPSDRSGSRGITRVDSRDPAALRRAIELAASVGLGGHLCIEEEIPGVEHGGDAFIVGGEVAALFITTKHLDGTIVRGHSLPCPLGGTALEAVRAVVRDHARHAGYTDGPLNFDVMYDPDRGPVIIEMSPRLGGNWIPSVIQHAYGVDWIGAAIASAMGDPVELSEPHLDRPCGSYVLGAPSGGTLAERPDIDRLRAMHPELLEFELDVRPGVELHPLRDSGDQIGRALFVMPDAGAESYQRIVAALEHSLRESWPPMRPASAPQAR